MACSGAPKKRRLRSVHRRAVPEIERIRRSAAAAAAGSWRAERETRWSMLQQVRLVVVVDVVGAGEALHPRTRVR